MASHSRQEASEELTPEQRTQRDATDLIYRAAGGRPLSRREAKRHPGWTTYRWRKAYRVCRSLGILDGDGNLLMSVDDAREALIQWRMGQSELAQNPNWVSPH